MINPSGFVLALSLRVLLLSLTTLLHVLGARWGGRFLLFALLMLDVGLRHRQSSLREFVVATRTDYDPQLPRANHEMFKLMGVAQIAKRAPQQRHYKRFGKRKVSWYGDRMERNFIRLAYDAMGDGRRFDSPPADAPVSLRWDCDTMEDTDLGYDVGVIRKDVVNWCELNLHGRIELNWKWLQFAWNEGTHVYLLYFDDDIDLVHFKMRWL